MRNLSCRFAILVLAAAALLDGCVERTVYVQQPSPGQPPPAVVSEAPPPPQEEVVVAAPGPDYVWTPGYWSWQGRWIWVGGVWAVRPHPHALWVNGRWARRGHGYFWVGGHWR